MVWWLQRGTLLVLRRPLIAHSTVAEWRETVAIPARIKVPRCCDAHDRALLKLALSTGADASIPRDQDLLSVATAFFMPIIVLATPWRHIHPESGSEPA